MMLYVNIQQIWKRVVKYIQEKTIRCSSQQKYLQCLLCQNGHHFDFPTFYMIVHSKFPDFSPLTHRISRSVVLQKSCFENFLTISRKTPARESFLSKETTSDNFTNKMTLLQVLYGEFCEILQNSFFNGCLQTTVSEQGKQQYHRRVYYFHARK